LEDAVWKDVRGLLRDPQRLKEEYERRLQHTDAKSDEASRELKSQIQKTKRTIARLIDAYEDGLLNKEEFEPRIRSSKERLDRLDTDVSAAAEERVKREELRVVIGHLEEFSRRVGEGLECLDWLTKREVIRSLVKRIEVGAEEVRIVYKVSSIPFVQGPASGASLQHCWRRQHVARGVSPGDRGAR
jgi:site-specific DNA recombinase